MIVPNVQAKFSDNYNEIESRRSQIFPGSSMIDEMRELLDNSNETRPMHMSESINAAEEQENMDDAEIMDSMDTTVLPEEDSSPKNFRSPGIFRPITVEEDDDMLDMARNLSFEQMIVFNMNIQFIKSILRLLNGSTNVIQLPPHVIVTGNVYIIYNI